MGIHYLSIFQIFSSPDYVPGLLMLSPSLASASDRVGVGVRVSTFFKFSKVCIVFF